MAVTITQIAQMAGVGSTTVTLVLKDSPKISPATRDRVLKVIEEMDYVPNHRGKLLRGGKTEAVGLLSSFFQNIFKMELVDGIERAIYGTNYQFQQFYSEDAVLPQKAREILFSQAANCVLAMGTKAEPALLSKLRNARKPLILIEDVTEGHSGVGFDNHAASRLAVEHLLLRGRKRIALVIGETAYRGHHFMDERLSGYLDIMKTLQLPYQRIFDIPVYNVAGGAVILQWFLALPRHERPDALYFASGDLTAAGFMQEAQTQGLKIPDDVAVLGFDDSVVAHTTYPALSSVRQPVSAMGKAAFELGVECMGSESPEPFERLVIFPPEIIQRQTT